MGTVLLDRIGTDSIPESASRSLPAYSWAACDLDAEKRCEREAARVVSWRSRLFNWLVEYNKY